MIIFKHFETHGGLMKMNGNPGKHCLVADGDLEGYCKDLCLYDGLSFCFVKLSD